MKNQNVNTEKVTIYTKEQGSLKSRLTNVGTIISLASIVIVILLQTGVIDQAMSETIKTIVYLLCSVGVLLGILNNPKGDGIYLPGIDYKLWHNPNEMEIRRVLGKTVLDSAKEIADIDIRQESENIKDKLENKNK